MASKHDELVSQLNATMRDLAQFCAKRNLDWGGVLHTSVNMHADDDSLQRIIDDLRDFMVKADQPPR